MTTEAIIEQKKPEPGQAFVARAQQYKASAIAITQIASAEDYKLAGEIFKAGAATIREITAFFQPIKSDAHRAWQNNCKREKTILDPVEEGKRHVGNLLEKYDAEQERIRRDNEARDRVALAKQNDDSTLVHAEALHAEGDVEGALALIDQGMGFAVAPVTPKTTPKITGMHYRSSWSAKLKGATDDAQLKSKMDLIKAVAAGTVSINALDINWPYLNRRATDERKLLNIPGVEAVEKRTPVPR